MGCESSAGQCAEIRSFESDGLSWATPAGEGGRSCCGSADGGGERAALLLAGACRLGGSGAHRVQHPTGQEVRPSAMLHKEHPSWVVL